MMDQSVDLNQIRRNWNNFNKISSTTVDIDWSVFENADRYLLRDDSAWITRLSRDFWWNLERISEMTITRANPLEQLFSTCKIVGQRSSHIPDKFNVNSDLEYNPFQSKFSSNANIWSNQFQQVVPWS